MLLGDFFGVISSHVVSVLVKGLVFFGWWRFVGQKRRRETRFGGFAIGVARRWWVVDLRWIPGEKEVPFGRGDREKFFLI